MEEYLLTCSCHNQDKQAKEAFSVMFPDAPIPPIIKGKDRLYTFAKKIGNDHLLAISKLSGKFAYYVELEDGIIRKEIDLIHGRKVA